METTAKSTQIWSKPVEIGDEIIDHRGELKGQAIWPLDQGYGVYIME